MGRFRLLRNRRRPLFGAASLLSAVLLVGCADSPTLLGAPEEAEAEGGTAHAEPPVSDSPGANPDPTRPEIPPAGSPTSTRDPDSPARPVAECENPQAELLNTGLGAHTALNRIPVTFDENTFFSFTLSDNRFDPCAELSWAVLDGNLTDREGLGGTGGSIGATTVFFHQDQLITEPLPFLMKTVEEVERVADNQLRVTHGYAGGATAEGVTETMATTHIWENDTLRSDLSELPPEVREQPTLIDVAADPLRPGATTTQVAQTLVAGQYRLPINEKQNLLCDIGHPEGVVADCYADFPTTWKMNSTQRPQATRILYTDDPPHARGTADPTPTASVAGAYGDVRPGVTTAVGDALVNLTQPNQVTITTESGGGILITPDSYEVLEASTD